MRFSHVLDVQVSLELSHAAVAARSIAHVSSYLIFELESILVHSSTALLFFTLLFPGRFHRLVSIYARLLFALSDFALFPLRPVPHLFVKRLTDANLQFFSRLFLGLDLSVSHLLQFLSARPGPPTHVSLLWPQSFTCQTRTCQTRDLLGLEHTLLVGFHLSFAVGAHGFANSFFRLPHFTSLPSGYC
jgi:hypothetical protein